MLAILFWVVYVLVLLGGSYYRWTTNPNVPVWGVDFVVMLLIGALGLRVFPVAL